MNKTQVPLFVATIALAGSVLLGGCRSKSNQPAANAATAASASSAASAQPQQPNPPPPPPDQQSAAANQQAPNQAPTNQSPAYQPPPNQQAANRPPAYQPPPSNQPPPPPAVLVIPAGSHLRVRLDQDLGSKISQSGDTFSATVADPVIVNGQTVIPQDARADGTVIDAKALGRFKGGAVLALRLERVHTRWGSYAVQTSTMERAEKGKGKRTGLFAGGGGAFGALIGGLAGGGKGALIGALAGAGAGTAGSAFTGNKEIVLPAETLITFRLERSVHITEGQ